jgi:hypothetical protein
MPLTPGGTALATHRMFLRLQRKTGAVVDKRAVYGPVLGMAAITEPCDVSGTAAALVATRVTQLHSLLTAGAVADAKYKKVTEAARCGSGQWSIRAHLPIPRTCLPWESGGGDVDLVQWTSPFPDQRSQIQRTNGPGDVLVSESSTKISCRRAVPTTHVPQMAIFDFDMWHVLCRLSALKSTFPATIQHKSRESGGGAGRPVRSDRTPAPAPHACPHAPCPEIAKKRLD